MMRKALFSSALSAGIFIISAGLAVAAEPVPAQSTPAPALYSIASTDIGTLLDNAAAKAIIDKYAPQFTANSQIEMARSMTLRQIQSYASDILTDEVLAKIDADLAKLPPNK